MIFSREDGTSVLEMLVAVALVATAASIGLPQVLHARDRYDGHAAARFLAGQLRRVRHQAVQTGRHGALLFDETIIAGRSVWTFVHCTDGDDDGVLRSDVETGVDTCLGRPQPIESWFSRVSIARAPWVPSPSGQSGGSPVTLGASRIASFSPLGTSSSGSITMATSGGRHVGVRLAGVTGRVRVVWFSERTQTWLDW